jgi:hypothetical protein
MKRSWEQKRIVKSVRMDRLSKMGRDPEGQMYGYLDVESKKALSHTTRRYHNALQPDHELRCLRQTNDFAACTGLFTRMRIGDECLVFCLSHVNTVISNLVNIMFSNQLFVRYTDLTVSRLHYPSIEVTEAAPDDEERFVFFIREENMDSLAPNQTIGEWAVEEYDFVNSNWLNMGIYFSADGYLDSKPVLELFYYFQDTEWVLNFEVEHSCILVQNALYEEEDEDESDEPDAIDLDEAD